METPKATNILNEILRKISLLTQEDELAQGIEPEEADVEVVDEEVVEEPKEEAQKEEAQQEVELEEDAATEEVEAEETELMEGYVKEERFEEEMSKMRSMIEAMKKMIDEEMGYVKKEKEMLSAKVEELSAEPATEAITHAPDQEEKQVIRYASNRPANTLDKVFQTIAKK